MREQQVILSWALRSGFLFDWMRQVIILVLVCDWTKTTHLWCCGYNSILRVHDLVPVPELTDLVSEQFSSNHAFVNCLYSLFMVN